MSKEEGKSTKVVRVDEESSKEDEVKKIKVNEIFEKKQIKVNSETNIFKSKGNEKMDVKSSFLTKKEDKVNLETNKSKEVKTEEPVKDIYISKIKKESNTRINTPIVHKNIKAFYYEDDEWLDLATGLCLLKNDVFYFIRPGIANPLLILKKGDYTGYDVTRVGEMNDIVFKHRGIKYKIKMYKNEILDWLNDNS